MTVDYGDRWECPACDALSACCYRCQQCGYDFAGDGTTVALHEFPAEVNNDE